MPRDKQQSSNNDYEIRKESVDYSSYATAFQNIPRNSSTASNSNQSASSNNTSSKK